MRIASYNIRKTRGLDQRYDPYRIVDVINGIGAQVLALQEADHRLGPRPAALSRRIIESETDFQVVEVAENDVSIGWHGNAVLVERGMKVEGVQRIDLPGLEPRGAISVDIESGGKAKVVATHLGLMRTHRRKQLDAIMDRVGGDASTIIAGDFNEWSPTRGLEALAQTHQVVAPGRSYHAARPVAALDRIAHGRAFALNDAGVVETPISRRASDHLPIWADITRRP